MVDKFDGTGLTVKTYTESRNDLILGYQSIYGADINVDQNSPDGQQIGITTQIATDLREVLVRINNGFDPDLAEGRILDQRAAINNVIRQGGTYTITPIDIVVSQTVTLAGLDDDFNDPLGEGYTISDDAGNEFILIDTQTLTAGSHTVNFRAKNVGLVETTTGTIQNPVTIVLGVTSVNNPSSPIQIGSEEETDAELRTRRQRSVALASNGYLNGIRAALLNLDGVSEAAVFENFTNAVDADGIPAHGIWAIVEGGANSDIADVIYEKKSYGSNMKGDTTVTIDTPSGGVFVARFDRPSSEDLYVRFDIQKIKTTAVFDTDAIKEYMVANIEYKIGQVAETSDLTALARAAIDNTGGGGVPVNVEISNDGATWVDYLETTTKDLQFTMATARITITEL